MKKAKAIIRDLKHNLKGTKRVFNTYDVEHNARETKNLYISELDIIRALADYEIDFKKRYGVDFDDVVYEDAQGNYESIDLDVRSDNSYNWCSQIVFNYDQIKVVDKYGMDHEYISVKFHRYGDVRGNYTDYMVCDMTMDEFYEVIMESTQVFCSVDYKGHTYSISSDCLKESCLFDIYCNETNEDYYDACLDIDNLRNKKDIRKGLVKYLKEVA